MLGKAGSKIWRCAIAIYLFSPCKLSAEKAVESAGQTEGTKAFYYAIKLDDDNILRGDKDFAKCSFRRWRINRLMDRR